LLTLYYSSYIKNNLLQVADTSPKPLVQYFCTNESHTVIEISINNATYYQSPLIFISIFNSNGNLINQYTVKADTPKKVIDLTADLARIRPEDKEIVSAKFSQSLFGGTSETFYQHCINVLSNIFISYTYDE
jgi:hypothetical protein